MATKVEKERVKVELMKGLDYIHSKFVAHYDIKPYNIFVPKDLSISPFFIDFGSSGRSHKNNTTWPGMKSFNWELFSQINFKGGYFKTKKRKIKKYRRIQKTQKK